MATSKPTTKQAVLDCARQTGWQVPDLPIPYGRDRRGLLYELSRDESTVSLVFDRNGHLRSASRTQRKGRANPLMTPTPRHDKVRAVLGWLAEEED